METLNTNSYVVMGILFLVSFLLGGIPTGYLISRRVKGIDIRQHGSGNPGAANVYRTVGARAGWATFLIDALKGCACVCIAFYFFPGNYAVALTCGAISICGHMWTPFLGFKGGKGVATSAGVFAALVPIPTAIVFGVFVIGVWISGHISVGSIAAAAALPIASFLIGHQPLYVNIVVAIVAIIVIVKHIPNMKRLLKKSELAFEDGSKKDKSDK
ncbi:glycerol-3-phosphate acyltransferase PlsY [Parelusimicrobium proximum]|uniref:glycerol-3-phosphate 1-O-acyltransferase PlsY n=1 Tax=Parelusimicrobium proximum TaxID=3228953 RepID=UPI003D16DDAA